MTRKPRKTPAARKSLSKAGKRVRAAALAAAKRDPFNDVIVAMARLLNLRIEHAWLPEIRRQFLVTLRHGALVADFSLPDDAEPAPVFEA